MVTYHYVKMYVSIIIQLEVININVHGIKMGGKNSTLSDIIKIWYVGRVSVAGLGDFIIVRL
jgi:hypothetical protein